MLFRKSGGINLEKADELVSSVERSRDQTIKFLGELQSHGLTYVRIQIISTPSGLRYMQSYPSGVGMTMSGTCDPTLQNK